MTLLFPCLSSAADSALLKQKIWHIIVSVFFLHPEVVFHPNYMSG